MLAEAHDVIEATGDRSQLIAFLSNMASRFINSGRPADGESLLYQARDIAANVGNPALESRVLENLIVALRKQGKWSALEELLTAYEGIQQEVGSEQGRANGRSCFAWMQRSPRGITRAQ